MRFTQITASQAKKTKWREGTIRQNYKTNTFISHKSETPSGAVGWEPRLLPVRPVSTPHLNGVCGFVPQLARLVFRLSPHGQESAALRHYIDSQVGLSEFAERNKATVVYVRPEPNHVPQVAAEWLNGDVEVVSLKDLPEEIIHEQIELLASQAGKMELERVPKATSTQRPTIQGFNFPFLKEANIAELPKLKLADAWQRKEPSDKYYRDDELWKLAQKPLIDGTDRKTDPLGPYATSKETPDNLYKY